MKTWIQTTAGTAVQCQEPETTQCFAMSSSSHCYLASFGNKTFFTSFFLYLNNCCYFDFYFSRSPFSHFFLSLSSLKQKGNFVFPPTSNNFINDYLNTRRPLWINFFTSHHWEEDWNQQRNIHPTSPILFPRSNIYLLHLHNNQQMTRWRV